MNWILKDAYLWRRNNGLTNESHIEETWIDWKHFHPGSNAGADCATQGCHSQTLDDNLWHEINYKHFDEHFSK